MYIECHPTFTPPTSPHIHSHTTTQTRALSTPPQHFNGVTTTTEAPHNPSAFEPRHLRAIAAAADRIINSFLDSNPDSSPVVQELSSAAAAANAANAVVPPPDGGVGVVRMQKLPWPGGWCLCVFVFAYFGGLEQEGWYGHAPTARSALYF